MHLVYWLLQVGEWFDRKASPFQDQTALRQEDGCDCEIDAELVVAVVGEESGAGGYAAEVAVGLARDASAAGHDVGRPIERYVGLPACATGEVCDRFAERCFGSARYRLLGATEGRTPNRGRTL